MPKLKTHSGAKRRFHMTGTGRLVRAKGGKSHFRRRKPSRTKRLYDEMIPLSPSDRPRVRRLLPYGVK